MHCIAKYQSVYIQAQQEQAFVRWRSKSIGTRAYLERDPSIAALCDRCDLDRKGHFRSNPAAEDTRQGEH